MAVAFQWVTNTLAQVGNTQASLSRGANTISSGDFLLAVVAAGSGGADPGAISAPDGTWTQIFNNYNSLSDQRTGVFYKFTTNDTGPYVFSWTNSVNSSFFLADYSGVSTGGFDGGAQTFTQSGSFTGTYTAPSVSPTATNSTLLCMWITDGGREGYAMDALLTSRLNQAGTGSGASTLALGEQLLSASGATGTRSYTVTFGDGWDSVSLCLAVTSATPSFTTYYAYQQPINLTS